MLNDSLLTTPSGALTTSRLALTAARERLAQAAAALSRAQAARSTANDRLKSLDDEDTARAAEYSRRCEQAAVDGVPAVPYLESAPDAAERHRAQIEARGAAEALERLTAAHTAAQEDVAAAEQVLRAAVDQVLDERAVELIETAERHLAALEQIGAELAQLLPDTRFAIAPGLASEPAAREMLKRLPSMPRSDIHIPLNELRANGPRLSRLDELRAQLMADQPEQHQAAA